MSLKLAVKNWVEYKQSYPRPAQQDGYLRHRFSSARVGGGSSLVSVNALAPHFPYPVSSAVRVPPAITFGHGEVPTQSTVQLNL